jgi:hypothetical protein
VGGSGQLPLESGLKAEKKSQQDGMESGGKGTEDRREQLPYERET